MSPLMLKLLQLREWCWSEYYDWNHSRIKIHFTSENIQTNIREYSNKSENIQTNIGEYLNKYPRIFKQISENIQTNIGEYLNKYPRIFKQISENIQTNIGEYLNKYPRIFKQISENIQTNIFAQIRFLHSKCQVIPRFTFWPQCIEIAQTFLTRSFTRLSHLPSLFYSVQLWWSNISTYFLMIAFQREPSRLGGKVWRVLNVIHQNFLFTPFTHSLSALLY